MIISRSVSSPSIALLPDAVTIRLDERSLTIFIAARKTVVGSMKAAHRVADGGSMLRTGRVKSTRGKSAPAARRVASSMPKTIEPTDAGVGCVGEISRAISTRV